MLYLAEVQKQKSGFGLGSGKAELKLLACQRGEQSWAAVPGSETIPADDANNLNAGTLVLVDLSPNKQIKGNIEEAANRLVSILQGFSRGQEKIKTKEEEIEQWMQSLTYQSQELQRREMELQVREEEIAQLESQRQEIQGSSEEAQRIRDDLKAKQQELDAALEKLQSEKQGMEAQLAQSEQSVKLDQGLATHVQELLDYLTQTTPPTASLGEQIAVVLQQISSQQAVLDEHWQRLEQHRSQAQIEEQEAEAKQQELGRLRQEWEQNQGDLAEAHSQLKLLEKTLSIQQNHGNTLDAQVKNQVQLKEQLAQLSELFEQVAVVQKVDIEALERMPIEELQGLSQNLQQDLDKIFQFVNGQEEELKLQRETIQELERQLANANDSDRWNIQRNLTDEQEAYQMLDQTLVGQRRNLRERQETLTQHQAVLARRQGHGDATPIKQGQPLDPVLAQIDQRKQTLEQQLAQIKQEIEQTRQSLEGVQGQVSDRANQMDGKRQAIEQLEAHLLQLRSSAAQLRGRITNYEEMLQPLQDKLNELKSKLEEVSSLLTQVQETEGHQQQAVAQLRDLLIGLMNSQSAELAAS
ncbi:pilus motility taxis protein HmpF [Laspinema sp. A4]|uniref:pilus motility taxis protein HmpF n=1 Tax=Laspinema sp. D2d TaxID=2953686 RepID=UPI0021BB8CAA|nr:pilus motility taxis protein HmpF [Laspinema sp. D2d]MCT7983425.1 pilus motility taxis protein HmpF [Laspinema sp. D2d]